MQGPSLPSCEWVLTIHSFSAPKRCKYINSVTVNSVIWDVNILPYVAVTGFLSTFILLKW